MRNDSLGNRMKQYEAVTKYTLTSRVPVILRVDGKAFHTFTRKMQKPFDERLISAMVIAAQKTANNMQGFVLAYIQSDECTFMINNNQDIETQPWFNNEVLKLVSITASMYTAYFNREMCGTEAMFDCRAFQMPEDDVPNVFVWRQRDWERNSIQMLSRSVYSHKELHGKSTFDMKQMLLDKNIDWEKLPSYQKYGTFILSGLGHLSERIDYYSVWKLIQGENISD
jgi:tRNA(His) guanylyltransferase